MVALWCARRRPLSTAAGAAGAIDRGGGFSICHRIPRVLRPGSRSTAPAAAKGRPDEDRRPDRSPARDGPPLAAGPYPRGPPDGRGRGPARGGLALDRRVLRDRRVASGDRGLRAQRTGRRPDADAHHDRRRRLGRAPRAIFGRRHVLHLRDRRGPVAGRRLRLDARGHGRREGLADHLERRVRGRRRGGRPGGRGDQRHLSDRARRAQELGSADGGAARFLGVRRRDARAAPRSALAPPRAVRRR